MAHKRAILRSMIQDVQWFYKTRNVEQVYVRQIRSRVTWIFIGAVILFFLPNLVPQLTHFLIEYAGGPALILLELFPNSGYGRQSSSNNDRGGLTDGITAPR